LSPPPSLRSMPNPSHNKPLRLGLLGGSFNPFHNAHLALADAARDRFNLDQVTFVPAGQPPHKEAEELAPPEDRYLMTILGVADRADFSVSRFELDKTGPSYTVETMEYFHTVNPRAELFFIVGADSVLELDTWRDPARIFTLGTLVAAVRPGYTDEKAPAVAAPTVWMDMPQLDITGTDIRRKVRVGEPIDDLVPPGVLEYIQDTGLYKG
jgi:nicotinate-nucleotide adenylyltransferase